MGNLGQKTQTNQIEAASPNIIGRPDGQTYRSSRGDWIAFEAVWRLPLK